MKFKRLSAFVLAMAVLFVSPAYARTASSSDASFPSASPSDALRVGLAVEPDVDWYDLAIDLQADFDFPTVDNTIDYSTLHPILNYYNSRGESKSITANINGQGYFSFSKNSDIAEIRSVTFYFQRAYNALPPPGKYRMSVRFNSNTGVSYGDFVFLGAQYIHQAAASSTARYLHPTVISGDYYFSTTVEIGNPNFFGYYFTFETNSPTNLAYGGYLQVNFTRISDLDDVEMPAPPGGSPSEDNEQAIVDSLGVISSITQAISGTVSAMSNTMSNVEKQNERIIDLLLEVVRTISNQLEAFWDQLAGEFTNLYAKMTDQHNELMDADRTNVEDHMENDDKNTDRIIDALGQNTNDSNNGYDNSGLLNENDKLSDSMDEYEAIEGQLLGETGDHINNFNFDNPFTQFTVVMADISTLLSGIYDALGSFNIPIGFSFTLTIAMLCIGWYRFKGGM